MATPLKGNEQILAEGQAFRDAHARAQRELGGLQNVVGVGMGLKQVDGKFIDDIAIVVYVRKKEREDDLPPRQRVPRSFDGYRTDVRVVADVRPGACNNKAKYAAIQGGIQITTKVTTTRQGTGFFPGTLGCIVRRRNDTGRENVYLLSCKHVLQSTGSGVADYIYHPFPPTVDHTTETLGPVMPGGRFENVAYVFSANQPPAQVFMDAAIARVDIDSKCCGSTCTKDVLKHAETIIDLKVVQPNTSSDVIDANRISDVRNVIRDQTFIGKAVFKVGRTTGKTGGRVTNVGGTFPTTGDSSVANPTPFWAQNALEIVFDAALSGGPTNCQGHAWFAEVGDSGSFVVDETNRVVGMITYVPTGNAPAGAAAYACHIVPILDRLGICVPCTTGTSHGSTRATDGSGLAPATTRAAELSLPPGTFVFADRQPTDNPRTTRPAQADVEPVPLAPEEIELMHARLAALRALPIGRELHDVFGEVRRELGYLVRNCRPVTVAWHRHKGPAFMAHILNHLAGRTDRIPHDVQGITRVALLTRMREVLAVHGSNPLRDALARHGERLLAIASRPDCNAIEDCIALLREHETA